MKQSTQTTSLVQSNTRRRQQTALTPLEHEERVIINPHYGLHIAHHTDGDIVTRDVSALIDRDEGSEALEALELQRRPLFWPSFVITPTYLQDVEISWFNVRLSTFSALDFELYVGANEHCEITPEGEVKPLRYARGYLPFFCASEVIRDKDPNDKESLSWQGVVTVYAVLMPLKPDQEARVHVSCEFMTTTGLRVRRPWLELSAQEAPEVLCTELNLLHDKMEAELLLRPLRPTTKQCEGYFDGGNAT